jgi:hypothetical protein
MPDGIAAGPLLAGLGLRACAALRVAAVNRIVTSSYDGTAREWDPATGKETEPQINADKAYCSQLHLALTARKLSQAHTTIRSGFGTATGAQLIAPLEANGYVESAAFSPAAPGS